MLYLLLGMIIAATPVLANAQVLVNEVAWMGAPMEGIDSSQHWRYEWVELFNTGTVPVSLEGWTLEFARNETSFPVSLSGSVAPGAFLLIAASEKIPGADISYGNLAGKLSNAGGRVLLKNQKGEVVQDINAQEGWFAGETEGKLTMERRFPGRDASNPSNWADSLAVGGTPKRENSVFLQEEPEPGSIQQRTSVSSARFFAMPPGFPLALGIGILNALAAIALRRKLFPSWWQEKGRQTDP